MGWSLLVQHWQLTGMDIGHWKCTCGSSRELAVHASSSQHQTPQWQRRVDCTPWIHPSLLALTQLLFWLWPHCHTGQEIEICKRNCWHPWNPLSPASPKSVRICLVCNLVWGREQCLATWNRSSEEANSYPSFFWKTKSLKIRQDMYVAILTHICGIASFCSILLLNSPIQCLYYTHFLK